MKTAIIMLLAIGLFSCIPDSEQKEEGTNQKEGANQSEQSVQEEAKRQELESALTDFKAEKAAWKALEIHSYRFTAYSSDYTTIPVTITVLPGTKPEVTYDEKRYTIDPHDPVNFEEPFYPFAGLTIDELYDSMEEVTTDYFLDYFPSGVTKIYLQQYNQKYHYPEAFYLSAYTLDGEAEDGSGLGLKITHFEVLE